MAPRRDIAGQRFFLGRVDAAFRWSVGLYTLSFSMVNSLGGSGLAVAILPLLFPIFIMPMVEGLVLGSVIRDSLRWRARAWVTFVVGVIASLGLLLILLGRLADPGPGGLVYIIVVGILVGVGVIWVSTRLVTAISTFYEQEFADVQVGERMDSQKDRSFMIGGAVFASLAVLGSVLWSFSLLGSAIPAIPPIPVGGVVVGPINLHYVVIMTAVVVWLRYSYKPLFYPAVVAILAITLLDFFAPLIARLTGLA